MNLKTLTYIVCFFISSQAFSQTDILFKSGYESIIRLNDTGIISGGDYPAGNNTNCISNITTEQDCHIGRDSNVINNSNSDGHAGFSFTKLDTTGNALPASATNWSCVKDNVTGLVWEVKTDSVGVHHKDNLYQWGGLTAIGRDHPNRQGVYYDSWNNLVLNSNDNSLCGLNDWRIPNTKEMSSIINKNTSDPAVDTNYFPNALSEMYWSSAPFAGDPLTAWFLYFSTGYESFANRIDSGRIRLVNSEF